MSVNEGSGEESCVRGSILDDWPSIFRTHEKGGFELIGVYVVAVKEGFAIREMWGGKRVRVKNRMSQR